MQAYKYPGGLTGVWLVEDMYYCQVQKGDREEIKVSKLGHSLVNESEDSLLSSAQGNMFALNSQ